MKNQVIDNYSPQYSLQSQLQVVPLRLDYLRDNQLNNCRIANLDDHEMISQDSQSRLKQFPNTGHDLFQHVFNPENQSGNFDEREEDIKSSQMRKKKQVKSEPVIKRKLQTINVKMSLKQKWNKCNKGQRYQTKNICNYLYNETANFLKVIANVYQLSEDTKKEVLHFMQKKNKSNLQVFKQLFRCIQLRSKCLEYYRSNQFAHNIFKSRADIKTKIRLIKYLKKIEIIPISQAAVRWKN